MTDLSMFMNTNAALLTEGRIFGLDSQLLFDILFQGIAVFLLFIFLSYVLIEPVKKILNDRQAKIKNDIESAAEDKAAAARLKEEYDARIKDADTEVSNMLSDARKKALKNEESIVSEAKDEAARIISRANQEAQLEKDKVQDEVRREIINVAAVMAGKFVDSSLDESKQSELIDETLKEMGDSTWQSR